MPTSDDDTLDGGTPAKPQARLDEHYYRRRAHELREQAARTLHVDVRQDLLALSLRYQQLAELAKATAEKAAARPDRAGDVISSEVLPEPD